MDESPPLTLPLALRCISISILHIYICFSFCLFPQEKPQRETEMAKLTESMSEYK